MCRRKEPVPEEPIMGFLIRTAVLGAIGIMLIPADPDEVARSGAAERLTALGTLGFVQAAVADVRGFCTRNPDACETGGQLVDTFEAKARTGAKWAYGFFSDGSALPVPVGRETAATPTPARPVPHATEVASTGSIGPPPPAPRPKPRPPSRGDPPPRSS